MADRPFYSLVRRNLAATTSYAGDYHSPRPTDIDADQGYRSRTIIPTTPADGHPRNRPDIGQLNRNSCMVGEWGRVNDSTTEQEHRSSGERIN